MGLDLLGTIGVFLGIGSIILSIFIAIRQSKVLENFHILLEKIRKIGEETHGTAQKIGTDINKNEMVQKFFFLQKGEFKKYKCFFPAIYQQKPLPLIVAGDFHALQVLNDLLGEKQMEIFPLNPKEKPPSDNSHKTENRIFLCTPWANVALRDIAPSVEISTENINNLSKIQVPFDLPCWFAEDCRSLTIENPIQKKGPKKTIWIFGEGSQGQISSPSDVHYDRAGILPKGETYYPTDPIQKDYGIICRITEATGKIIVLAGIHQYGTWIVAEFFRQLSEGPEKNKFSELFLKGEDFIAILWGEFNSQTLQVKRFDIDHHHCWIKEYEVWKRLP